MPRTIQVTNQLQAHSLPGAAVLITLNATESVSKLPLLAKDMKCTLGSSGNIGYIASVDSLGHSFQIQPIQRDKSVDGNIGSNVVVGEIIAIIIG